MLNSQENENKKLRDVLEGLGKNLGKEDETQWLINAHSQKLQDLAGGKTLYGQ